MSMRKKKGMSPGSVAQGESMSESISESSGMCVSTSFSYGESGSAEYIDSLPCCKQCRNGYLPVHIVYSPSEVVTRRDLQVLLRTVTRLAEMVDRLAITVSTNQKRKK